MARWPIFFSGRAAAVPDTRAVSGRTLPQDVQGWHRYQTPAAGGSAAVIRQAAVKSLRDEASAAIKRCLDELASLSP
jgi:hypothetical protein